MAFPTKTFRVAALALVAAAALAALFLGTGVTLRSDPPATSEATIPNTEAAPMAEDTTPAPDWNEFATRWAGAPEDIRAIARTIAEGGVPAGDLLTALGPDGLSRGYRVPEWSKTVDDRPVTYTATLLHQAVLSINADAVRALLDAGAEPSAHHNQAIFAAIAEKSPGAPPLMLFPDHDATLPILSALLEADADADLRRFGFRESPLEFSRKIRNLGAIQLLLEHGGDPWVQRSDPPTASGFVNVRPSAMQALIDQTGGASGAELAFRVLRAGPVPRGSETAEKNLLQALENAVGRIEDGSGPNARHRAWRMDQVLTVFARTFEAERETAPLRARLPSFDAQEDGGWYLAEGEIHSRHDAPAQVPDKGTEIWGP